MPARKTQPNDVIKKLADTGEEALQKLAELPGSARVIEVAQGLRDRVDELTRRMRSLDPLEKRVAELEKRLDELTKPKRAPAKKTAASRSAKKPAAAKSSTRSPKS